MIIGRRSSVLQDLSNIARSDAIVVAGIRSLAKQSRNLSHRSDGRGTLDGQVRLVSQGTFEVVGRDPTEPPV